jgi:hypothetical protein
MREGDDACPCTVRHKAAAGVQENDFVRGDNVIVQGSPLKVDLQCFHDIRQVQWSEGGYKPN